MLVLLHGDTLHIDLGRGGILVTKCVLGIGDAACIFGYHSGIGVTGLVQVDMTQTRQLGILLQILGKGVGGQRLADVLTAAVVGGLRLGYLTDWQLVDRSASPSGRSVTVIWA